MVRSKRQLLSLLAALCLSGCLSPTLPLPPPDRPDVSSPDVNGLVRIQGFAAPKAEVVAWNHQTTLIAGQVTGDDAAYDFTMKASASDFIELWYIQGGDASPSVRITVPSK